MADNSTINITLGNEEGEEVVIEENENFIQKYGDKILKAGLAIGATILGFSIVKKLIAKSGDDLEVDDDGFDCSDDDFDVDFSGGDGE